jgi:calcium-dependent protein kinase
MGCGSSNETKEKEVEKKKKQVSQFSNYNIKKNFEFISMLGNGAFGKVRLYRDKNYKELLFAIKTMKKKGIDKNSFQLLKSEVKILSELDHPNIVKYFGTFEDEYYIHILMEYLRGYDLYKIISLKDYTGIDEKDMSNIIYYLLKALLFIHSKNIVHRDLKPENILFSNKDDYSTLKLIDFGLATNVLTIQEKKKSVVGTPYYMSPEIIDGNFDEKTDIWSLGIVMHQMLTGKFPFEPNKNEDLFQVIKNKKFDTELLYKAECSEEVIDLVQKTLEKDPSKRISTQQCLEHPWITKYFVKNNSHLINNQTISTLKDFSKKTALQKEIYFFIAKISSEKEILELKRLFNELDVDNSGILTISEINQAFSQIGIDKNDLQMIWDGLDFHKDGQINYTEFLAAMVSSYKFEKEEKIWSVFCYFKENNPNDDYISVESLLKSAKALNLSLDENEIRNNFDKLEDKRLNFEDFKKIILGDKEQIL